MFNLKKQKVKSAKKNLIGKITNIVLCVYTVLLLIVAVYGILGFIYMWATGEVNTDRATFGLFDTSL